MKNERQVALEILLNVDRDKAYSNITINKYLRKYKIEEGAFIRELVYGVIENKIFLDYWLSLLVKTGFNKLKIEVLIILRMALYQLIFLSGVPAYAIVNESVNLSRKHSKRHAGFVNAVLRNYLRIQNTLKLPDRDKNLVRFLSIKYSYEPWMIKKWLNQYSESFTEALLKAGNEKPDITIRVNALKAEKETLKELLTAKGFEVSDGKYVEEALTVKGNGLIQNTLFEQGMYQVQDESSMLAVKALNPQPGELMLDVCAAPGGKTLFAAELMQNKGHIIARDVHPHKIDLMNKSIKSHDIDIISKEVFDAQKLDEALVEKVDKVLVDVPCSGLGVIRRKPEIKYNRNEEDIEEFNRIQYQILANAAYYVKPGGMIVYSTCTIMTDENEKVIKEFLSKNCGFSIMKPFQDKLETLMMENNMIQLFPNKNKTDGFFICKLLKKK